MTLYEMCIHPALTMNGQVHRWREPAHRTEFPQYIEIDR